MKRTRVTLLLIDGDAAGRIQVSIAGWDGCCFLVPRTLISSCKDIPELAKSNVYFLLSNPNTEEDIAYIGQASIRKKDERILPRLIEHDNPKEDYWTSAVVFVRKNESFDQTELNYLENRFWKYACETGRYEIKNATEPILGYIKEETKDELDDYIEQAFLALKFLGFRIFERREEEKPEKVLKVKPYEESSSPSHVNAVLPALPSTELKSGDFVKRAMKSLQDSGYVFSKEQLDIACTVEGSKPYTHRNLPLFWRLKEEESYSDMDENIRERYWKNIYIFGNVRFLMFSQWYPDNKDNKRNRPQKEEFIAWYSSLGTLE